MGIKQCFLFATNILRFFLFFLLFGCISHNFSNLISMQWLCIYVFKPSKDQCAVQCSYSHTPIHIGYLWNKTTTIARHRIHWTESMGNSIYLNYHIFHMMILFTVLRCGKFARCCCLTTIFFFIRVLSFSLCATVDSNRKLCKL